MERGNGTGANAAIDPLQVLEFWKDFDLDGRRPGLDRQCTEMREAKTASIAGRKRLNELTKSFRALSPAEQGAAVNDLLKSYQKEIDQLSTRSKLGESAFFSLYKAVYEAPDPTPAMNTLSAALMESSTLQLEIEKLHNEIKQYDDEFQQLKNQDITIRRLEDQIEEYKDSIEDKVDEEVARRSAEIETEAESKVMEVKAAHYGAEKRLVAALEELKQARDVADRCQSQLYELSAQGDKQLSALRADMAIVEDDAERLRSRVADLERQLANLSGGDRGDGLGEDGDEGGGSGGRHGPGSMESLLSEFQSLQILTDELRQQLRRKEDDYRTEKARSDTTVRELNLQISVQKDNFQKASAELSRRPTVEELESLKKQLRAVQRIAFHAQDDDNEITPGDGDRSSDDVEQLETLLVSRLRSLESDLTEARSTLLETKKSEKLLRTECESLRSAQEDSAALIARLEADLEVKLLRADRSSRFGGGASPGVVVKGDNGLSELLNGDLPDRTSNDSENNAPPQSIEGAKNKSIVGLMKKNVSDPAVGAGETATSVIGMLQAQRDRYKERLGQVELELQSQRHTIQHITNEKAQLESDNLTLYQKIRFLQSTSNSNSRGGSDLFANTLADAVGPTENSGPNSLSFKDRDRSTESKYRQLYEEKISPFSQFSQFERQRKLKELTVAERIVLNTTIAMVSNPTGRSILLGYLIAMHVLVFFTMYYMAHNSHAGACDPHA